MAILETRNLSKAFGALAAVDDVSLAIEAGTLHSIIGAFVFIWLSESVSTLWARWPLLLGVAFVIVVLFLRGGVVEAWSRLWQSSKPKI